MRDGVRTRTAELVIGTLLCAAVPGACAAEAPAAAEIGEIAVFRTPGKPMALFESGRPAEEVVARRTDAGAEILVRVNVPREGIASFTERTAPLTPAEWQELADLVARQGIAGWRPGRGDGPAVVDFGEAGLSVRDGAGEALAEEAWIGPVQGEEKWKALAAALAARARAKLPETKLHYLP